MRKPSVRSPIESLRVIDNGFDEAIEALFDQSAGFGYYLLGPIVVYRDTGEVFSCRDGKVATKVFQAESVDHCPLLFGKHVIVEHVRPSGIGAGLSYACSENPNVFSFSQHLSHALDH